MRRAGLLALLGAAMLLGPGAAGAEAPIPPAPTRWVTDTAGFLSPPILATLDARLEAVQARTGHQVVIWIGQSLNGAPLDDWAVRTFAAWKVGRKGIDDGLAMFVLAGDRTVDIEVGYGLEGSVTDALASRIIHDVMAPRLRAGDHDGALVAGTDALLQAIGAGDVTGGAPVSAPLAQRRLPPWPQLILYALLAAGFLVLLVTHPRLAMYFLWSVVSGGRGGGSSGGGGGGGFSGGGGRSGGGGARGSW